jgi:hypothetical protein
MTGGGQGPRGADLRRSLEAYAALPAEFIAAYDGCEFARPFEIGGRR